MPTDFCVMYPYILKTFFVSYAVKIEKNYVILYDR